MQEPKKIPLTDNPRSKEPIRIPLKQTQCSEAMLDNSLDIIDNNCDPQTFGKINENFLENSSQSIQSMETEQKN